MSHLWDALSGLRARMKVEWHTLSMAEKKEFDMAMAKELSQVVISKALRNLTTKENKTSTS